MNTRNIEEELLEEFSNEYRTIWVQYCTISKRRSEFRVCITLFPIVGSYTMLFSDTINSIDYDTISNLINN